MAILSYSADNSTVTFGDLARLTIGATQIVTSNATTLALRAQVSGTINGTLDIIYGGNFQTLAGVPIGGSFTSLRVDLNGQTLMSLSDFTIPFGAGPPDFSNLQVFLGGNDVITGGALNDLLEGFAGTDSMSGGAGLDIMQGNTGADSLNGGDGNDILRGGRDNDSLIGGTGNDFLSGDRGDDTVSGGAGADIFHVFGGSGIERITDFNRAEGDRVFVLGGSYTVSQVGGDTVIDMGSGTQMILVGVQQSSLTGDWIF